MNYFIARKERNNRNATIHLQVSYVVLYHWRLTCSEEISDLEHKGEKQNEQHTSI